MRVGCSFNLVCLNIKIFFLSQEVNEVVQKVYGGEKPVPIWLDENEENGGSSMKRILFSLNIRVKVRFQ